MAPVKRTNSPGKDMTAFGRLDEGPMQGVLGYRLAQASGAADGVFAAMVGEAFELRQVEFALLSLIDRNPGVTASQLAAALGMTPPNIAAWMERLEGRGLVERERSAADRRSQHIRATAAGSELAQQAAALLLEGEAAALDVLSPAERLLLVELLQKIARCRVRR